jgi:hypothetical protein
MLLMRCCTHLSFRLTGYDAFTATLREDNMKKTALIAPVVMALGLSLGSATPAMADVGVSINIGEPNFFGRIDIGDAPPPVLRAQRPVIIERGPPGAPVEPIYLHVPLSESRNWRNYCGHYDACGRPVYFVQDTWYRNVYVPHYHAHRQEFDQRYHERHDDRHDTHGERRDERNNGHDDHRNGHDDHDHH